MKEKSTRAFADVARGLLIAVAFSSFAVGIYQASSPAVAETTGREMIEDNAFRFEIKTDIADVVVDVAKISGVLTVTTSGDGEREQCDLDPTSI